MRVLQWSAVGQNAVMVGQPMAGPCRDPGTLDSDGVPTRTDASDEALAPPAWLNAITERPRAACVAGERNYGAVVVAATVPSGAVVAPATVGIGGGVWPGTVGGSDAATMSSRRGMARNCPAKMSSGSVS